MPNSSPDTSNCAKSESGRRVLAIEEHAVVARTLQRMLELGGHVVRVVSKASQATAEALQFQPDAVIIDIGTARYDALSVVRDLRRNPSLAGCTFIGLTSYENDRPPSPPDFLHVLRKPFEVAALARVLGTARRSVCTPIPAHAKSLKIPAFGEVHVFQDGSTWMAVQRAAQGAPSERTGSGTTVADAVANLLMDE